MWIVGILGGLAALLVAAKYIYQYRSSWCRSANRLDGKLVIVTGASAGIGLATALDMARRGARVIMACRNLDKAQKVADRIISETGNKNVTVKKLDLASLASVRAFANDILRTERAIHILINNAGCASPRQRIITDDGLEMTMQSNHFGHFLLTNMLGGLLKEGAPSRIVCVSSEAHKFPSVKLDPNDLSFRNIPYSIMTAYGLSKLCNVLMARELSNRLTGTGVTAYSVHPGLVASEIMSTKRDILSRIMYKFMQYFGKTAESGAQTTIYCAVDDAVAHQSGLYYCDCAVITPSEVGQHDGMAAKLWAASELDVKLEPHEANI